MRKPLIGALLALATPFSLAADTAALRVDAPYLRLPPPGAAATGAFMRIDNAGSSERQLVRADSPAADKVELHTHLNENGVMKMRQVDAVTVEAGSSVAFKPGSYHIMLIGLHNPLKAGQRVPLTLVFEKSGQATVEVQVDAVDTEATHTMPMKH